MNKIVIPLLLVFLSLPLVKAQTDENRPNVLLLIADDLNSWLLGDPERYAGKVIAPNLLEFAGTGVNFARAYTASPVCSPSRTAFFSGVAPWTSGHYHNSLKVEESEQLKDAVSLGTSFKNDGYTTLSYGKISHGGHQRDAWDENVGHRRDPNPPGYPSGGQELAVLRKRIAAFRRSNSRSGSNRIA